MRAALAYIIAICVISIGVYYHYSSVQDYKSQLAAKDKQILNLEENRIYQLDRVENNDIYKRVNSLFDVMITASGNLTYQQMFEKTNEFASTNVISEIFGTATPVLDETVMFDYNKESLEVYMNKSGDVLVSLTYTVGETEDLSFESQLTFFKVSFNTEGEITSILPISYL